MFLESKIENCTIQWVYLFLSDLLFGSLIAENPSYLTGVGLYDAITSMSSIFTFDIIVSMFWSLSVH